MKCVMAKFVLRLLLPELKEHRTVVVNDLIQTATNEQDFFKKVITRDESWVYGYNPERRASCPNGSQVVLLTQIMAKSQ